MTGARLIVCVILNYTCRQN